MSVKHKISGFLSAVIIAVLCFFGMFFFFPEYSEKYLGTSFKSDKQAQKTVAASTTDLLDKANKNVTDSISNIFKK